MIEPQEVIKTHGAEILRLWAASVEFGEDVSISPDMLARLSEAYRKLRNTFRYCLGNLYDFDPAKDVVDASQLEEIDSWAHGAHRGTDRARHRPPTANTPFTRSIAGFTTLPRST